MTNSDENPVNIETARVELGRPGKPWPRVRLTAIKKAMGITSRWFFVSDVRRWMRANKNFKASDHLKVGKERPSSGTAAAGNA